MIMKHYLHRLLFSLTLLSGASTAYSAEGVHWEYTGKYGVEHWGDLSPDYVRCKVGVNQSPIDITTSIGIDAALPPLTLNYAEFSTAGIINNGHTAELSVDSGASLEIDGEQFELLQIHFHAPSEHRINGQEFLLESHYVHANAQGELAVIGILHNEGKASPLFAKVLAAIPRQLGKTIPFVTKLSGLPLITGNQDYYRYSGSLTTPPCSEGVRWFVLNEPRSVTREQQAQFIDFIGEDARTPQPINARRVLR